MTDNKPRQKFTVGKHAGLSGKKLIKTYAAKPSFIDESILQSISILKKQNAQSNDKCPDEQQVVV